MAGRHIEGGRGQRNTSQAPICTKLGYQLQPADSKEAFPTFSASPASTNIKPFHPLIALIPNRSLEAGELQVDKPATLEIMPSS